MEFFSENKKGKKLDGLPICTVLTKRERKSISISFPEKHDCYPETFNSVMVFFYFYVITHPIHLCYMYICIYIYLYSFFCPSFIRRKT